MTEERREIHDLSWDDFEDAARVIAEHFWKVGKITHVVGIPRGGCTLAVKLSHHLNVPFETHANVTPRHSTLIVDDMVDSGATLEAFSGFPHRAVWVTKKPSKSIFHVLHITNDAWMLFPWESPKRAEADRDTYYSRRLAAPPLKEAADR